MTNNYGHWDISEVGEFSWEDYVGFVYLITNVTTGQKYIGKKNLSSKRSITVAGRKNKKWLKKESDWKKYKSSSKYVKADIKELGIESFQFKIVLLCKAPGILSYCENNLLHITQALTTKLEDGSPAYYNAQIGATKYIPKEGCPDEVRNKFLNKE